MNEYYVYEWFIVDNLEVFYVGKGKGMRRFKNKRNQYFNRILNKYDCAVRLVASGLTEQEAIDLYTYLYYDRPAIQDDFKTLADYLKWADERGYFYADLVECEGVEK